MTAFLNLWGRKKSLLLLAYLVWIAVFRFSDGIQVFTSELSLVSVCIISVASLLPFVISQYKPVFVEYRTPIIFLPIACILTAVLISRLGFRVWTAIILILFVAGSTIRSGQNLVDPDPYPTRTSVQYVVERAKCGDTLVLGSLSISEVEYYLRRLGAPDCIERETFPLDTQDHPGWMDVPGLLRRRGELALEATETAARLAERSGATVWLFYGDDSCYGHEVTDILKPRLDNQLDFVKTLDLEGSFFDSVRVYSAKH
jgi:hypothetical protein